MNSYKFDPVRTFIEIVQFLFLFGSIIGVGFTMRNDIKHIQQDIQRLESHVDKVQDKFDNYLLRQTPEAFLWDGKEQQSRSFSLLADF